MTWQSGLPRVETIAARPSLVNRQEVVGMGGGAHRVHGDLEVAVGAVLEAHRHREAARQLRDAPGSRWCARRSRPSSPGRRGTAAGWGRGTRSPRAARGSARSRSRRRARYRPSLMAKEWSRSGSLMSPLPAHRGARLLEVHAHDDDEGPPRSRSACVARAAGVVLGGGDIVDRARAHHHHQAVVLAAQAAGRRLARQRHRGRGVVGHRQLLHQDRRRQQRAQAIDADVVGDVAPSR